ncbi:hypothetical protein SAMN05877838_3137 [Hoeflea halophila]|uniref:Uncharacterized protein n=1 Tax=Hoeflea halophila TaxID=714899 RepID=A0A286IFV3_9HYPH|nr:hypothetical protein [Hoeflea halophila]SOE18219.1 hypothetical protein SAMN05877838_3137 [Hoeflea halophila]
MQKAQQTHSVRIKHLLRAGEVFDRKTLAAEPSLFASKWFDYRFISPYRATMLFVRTYQDVFRRKIAQVVDKGLASNVSGIKATSLKNNDQVRTQVWKARQRADEVGMPYDLYIEAAFEFALNRNRTMMPQPNQLHFPGNAEESWKSFRDKVWADRIRNGLFKVTHPAYRVENYRGLVAQDEYRQFVRLQASDFHKPLRHVMQRYCFEFEQMPPEIFEGIVSPEVFDNELAVARQEADRSVFDPEPLQPFEKDDLWPSCFGLPHARNPEASPCSDCRECAGCKLVGEGILKKLMERHGSTEPKDDHKKTLARERKRKQRRLEKERATTDAKPENETRALDLPPENRASIGPEITLGSPEAGVTLSN